jgi:hypothetical protein
LMHALSLPDEYEFKWRNGELCIAPKPVSSTPLTVIAERKHLLSSRSTDATTQLHS